MQKRQLWLHFIIPVSVLLLVAVVIGIAYAYDDWQRSILTRRSALRIGNEVRIAAKDLAEQISMARFAYWQAWLSFGAVIVSAIGLLGLFYSLMQTRDALKTTRHFAEIESSAFLHAKSASWGEENAIVLKIWNSGQTPAGTFIIYLNTTIYKDGQLQSILNFELNNPKKTAMVPPNDHKDIRVDLPEKIDIRKLIEPSFDQINDDDLGKNSLEMNKDNVLFSGEIHYKNIHNKVYRTQFAFFVGYSQYQKFKQPACDLVVHEYIGTHFVEHG